MSAAPQALAATVTPVVTAPTSWVSQVEQQKIQLAHEEHVWHAQHIAHVTAVNQRIAAAKAEAAYEARQRKLRQEQAAAEAAAQRMKPAVTETVATPVQQPETPQAQQPAAQVQETSAPAQTYTGSSSEQACIISRESGGNPDAMNASGHYGLYQFSESTWVGSGGSAADFGHASVSEQNQVFANAVAARGYSDWAPYDGC